MAGSTNELYKAEIEKLARESGMPGLFLRRASALREEGKFEEAILEVKKGLQKFPGNPAAYYFLITLFLDLKKPRQAEITLNSASKYFSVNDLTAWYRELISEVEAELEGTILAEREAISRYSIPENSPVEEPGIEADELHVEETVEELFADEEEPRITGSEPENFDFDEDSGELPLGEYSPGEETFVEERPEDLPFEEEPPVEPDTEIVTAGMAIIHARQGNTEKAIEIFRKLIEKEPEKRENYEKIIQLLNSKIVDQ